MTFDLALTDEQDAIIASARGVLAGPLDWRHCADIGWFGLALPEDAGGVGFGIVEAAVLQREIGRALVAGPFLPTVVAARAALDAGDQDLLGSLVTGEVRASALVGRFFVDGRDDDVAVVIRRDGLTVFDAASIELGDAVDPVDGQGTVRRASVTAAARVSLLGTRVWHYLLILAAAQLTGIAERARDLAVEHAINREQFGRPIGVNQAVKHPCADMAVRADLAYAQVLVAARALDGGDADAGVEAASAAAVGLDAALANGRAAIQCHGGMGFTAEHPVHRTVGRARVVERIIGGRAAVLDALVD